MTPARFLACLLPCWLLATPALAERHALLVGVDKPAEVLNTPALLGVREDIAIMIELAAQWGVAPNRRQVLAEAPDASALPTHAALASAFDRLEREAQPGDEVLIYLSGHGTQQPVTTNADHQEVDGLDEVFLLRDSRPWTDESGSIGNALIDNDLRLRLEALTRRGVFVWLVADSCHAGTLSRSGQASGDLPHTDNWVAVARRRIAPDRLGINLSRWVGKIKSSLPRKQSSIRKRMPGLTPSSADENVDMPPFIAFYAVESHADALEIELRAERRRVGLFTHLLMAAFQTESKDRRKNPDFEELAESLFAQYRSLSATVPRPVLEGSAWSRPVFYGTKQP